MKIGVIYNIVDEIERGFDLDKIADNEILETVNLVINALKDEHEVIPIRLHRDSFFKLHLHNLDFIFNLCEGLGGDVEAEALIPAYLDILQIPYSGSDHVSLAICLNKVKTKELLHANHILTPKYQVFTDSSTHLKNNLTFPVIVKPIHEDASIGITIESVVYRQEDLNSRIKYVLTNYNQPALVEEYIDGRELNVALIGNGDNIEVLPISEIMFDLKEGIPKIVDYASKWIEDSDMYKNTKGVCPTSLPPELEKTVKKSAIDAYIATGCRDYGRVDFRLNGDQAYILEVNPNPGINIDSGYYRSIHTTGLDYAQMIKKICQKAFERYDLKISKPKEIKPLYETIHLVFNQIRIEDIEILQQWFNSPNISQYMAEPESLSSIDDLIQNFLLSDDPGVFTIILDKLSGRKIGYASIYDISKWNQTAEISFLIGESDFQGKKLGIEIVESLKQIAWENLKLSRLIATATEINFPSLKTLEHCGFHKVGVLCNAHILKNKKYNDVLFECIH